MLSFVVTQEAVVIAMGDRASGNHLGVEQGVFGELA